MRATASLCVAVAVAGCATATRGTTNKMNFVSVPEGAEMRTSAGHICTTPCTIEIPRKQEFTASFSKPGYDTQEVSVATRMAGEGAVGAAASLVAGGLVGLSVDALSGATLEHYPNPVSVTLEAVRATPGERARRERLRQARPEA